MSRSSFSPPPRGIHSLLLVCAGILIGAVTLGVLWAANSDDGDVRVVARPLEDGRVEVGLQQRSDAGWGERELPAARFLAADSEPGVWRASSPLSLSLLRDAPINRFQQPHQLGPFSYREGLTATRPVTPDTLFCLVTHGTEDDLFWRVVYDAASTSALQLGIQLRASLHEESGDQADAIRECIEDDAAVVATTLADIETLRPALALADGNPTRIVTFNSGRYDAPSVRSVMHLAIDETRAGQIAAEQFASLNVDGSLLCVIHERANIGLEERCAALEADHDGAVEVYNISAEADKIAAIRAAATGHAGVLTLNANTTFLAAEALAGRDDIVLGAIGSSFPDLPALLYHGVVAFSIWDQPQSQGHLIVPLMLLVHGLPFNDDGLISGTRDIALAPQVVLKKDVDAILTRLSGQFREVLPTYIAALEAAIERHDPNK